MLNRLREKGKRLGIGISKLRGQDRYMLYDLSGNYVLAGGQYELTIQDVNDYLDEVCDLG